MAYRGCRPRELAQRLTVALTVALACGGLTNCGWSTPDAAPPGGSSKMPSRSESTAAPAPEHARLELVDAAGPVTFARDVAPILYARCTPCHRPGESAPFSLLTYGDARQRARLIADVTARRVMPPWLPSGGDHTFVGERRLTDAEASVLRRWHEQGAPEGDAASTPAAPIFEQGWRLGKPDLIVSLPAAYQLRADGPELWRNFVLPIGVDGPRFVKAVEIRPGNPRVVHHAIMGVDSTRSSARRDARDAEPGFEGMELGDAQPPDGHLLGWTPGMAPVPPVEGAGWRVAPGDDLVLQLHLTPSGKPEHVQPQVGLYFAAAPPAGPPMYLLRLDADQLLDIPAGTQEFVVTDRFALPVAVKAVAIYPHAHFLAHTMEARATLPGGSEQTLIRIDAWDFKWQDVYRYREPLTLPKGTIVSFRYTYDNSTNNPRNPSTPPVRVRAGMRSSDEMAHLQLQVQVEHDADVATLRKAFYQEQARKAPDDPWVHYELGNLLRDAHDEVGAAREYRAAIGLDPRHAAALTNLGVLLQESGNITEAVARYRDALRAEADFVPAHFNLANALRASGQAREALDHYQRAIALEPTMAAAHNNLGELLASQGQMGVALAHFRRAVALNAASAMAHANLGAALGAMGQMDEAVRHFRQALAIDPNHEPARRNLEIALSGGR